MRISQTTLRFASCWEQPFIFLSAVFCWLGKKSFKDFKYGLWGKVLGTKRKKGNTMLWSTWISQFPFNRKRHLSKNLWLPSLAARGKWCCLIEMIFRQLLWTNTLFRPQSSLLLKVITCTTNFSMLIWSSSFIWSQSIQEENTCKVQTCTSCYFFFLLTWKEQLTFQN